MSDEYPRRIQMDKFTPTEKLILDAVRAVESLPADTRLTQASILLQEARNKVADFVDGVKQTETRIPVCSTCGASFHAAGTSTAPEPSVAAEALESFVNISPVVMEGFPDAHKVTFDVGSQHFDIAPHGCETKEDAEWMRDMFLRALSKAAHPGIVPGWVMTPSEPTKEMYSAARWSGNQDCNIREEWVLKEIYSRMIAAAPKGQPAGFTEEDEG